MNKHEKLKQICDLIWYESKFDYDDSEIDEYNQYDRLHFTEYNKWTWFNRIVNVREIIFTKEFMDKYYKYFNDTFLWLWDEVVNVLNNLDSPVDYLYNTLELWD